MRYRLLSVSLGLVIKAYLFIASIFDAWRYPPWERPALLTRLSVNGETVVFLAPDTSGTARRPAGPSRRSATAGTAATTAPVRWM
jgi:hypothetical protein